MVVQRKQGLSNTKIDKKNAVCSINMSREDYVSKCHDYSLRFSFLFTYRFSLVVTNKDAQYITIAM